MLFFNENVNFLKNVLVYVFSNIFEEQYNGNSYINKNKGNWQSSEVFILFFVNLQLPISHTQV